MRWAVLPFTFLCAEPWLRIGVGLWIFGEVALADEHTHETTDITSVLAGRKRVFASTQKRLYEGSLEDHSWIPRHDLKTMPGGGGFAGDPDGALDLYYYAGRPTEFPSRTTGIRGNPFSGTPTMPSDWEYGLYRLPAGRNQWERQGKEESFHHLVVHGTQLIAIAGPKPGEKPFVRVMCSRDQGVHWTDLTPQDGFQSVPVRLFPDPDQPDLVCLRAQGLRTYIIQASDARYQWREERESSWQHRHRANALFLEAPYASGKQVSYIQASLENYFQLPFGNQVLLPRWILTTGGALGFEKGREVVVTVSVVDVGRPGNASSLKLLDLWDGIHFWGMRRIRPDGEVEHFPPQSVSGLQSLRDTPEWRTEVLHPGQVYRRTLNLSKIAPFSEKGRYRVQVGYDSSWVAKLKAQEWSVQLEAPVVEIEIR